MRHNSKVSSTLTRKLNDFFFFTFQKNFHFTILELCVDRIFNRKCTNKQNTKETYMNYIPKLRFCTRTDLGASIKKYQSIYFIDFNLVYSLKAYFMLKINNDFRMETATYNSSKFRTEYFLLQIIRPLFA